MRIGSLAQRFGTTPDTIRFYEREGLIPRPKRADNRYREYSEADAERVRLLIGLRQLDLPLEQAAELAGMCAEGRCSQVSIALRDAVAAKREELMRRIEEMHYIDGRLARLEAHLATGESLREIITTGKEEEYG